MSVYENVNSVFADSRWPHQYMVDDFYILIKKNKRLNWKPVSIYMVGR